MSQLPIARYGKPPAGKMVDGMTWERFCKLEKEKERRYKNGMDSRATYEMHLKDFARKREQFFS